ncbi:uroporphyrinogen decarboxylase [Raineyella antarctica]|uniref:Uroporphyrinogen decarboxylase n=1 Tax=Raineyella antarctica TaxID=1577474 RepID=A0A1G6GPR9_9ACTN|nr:uroporphyrinogen decarboxylase [Raineyella antarctica]SDB83939.1 uroporphyrinogen decarboxylase [Raineyella antarctica]
MTQKPTLLAAAAREQGNALPVWFMRQAGRSLPEYRAVREGTAMLDSCRRPEMVVEITMQPVRRHDVDAAIFFSDIMVPLAAAGVGLEIKAGVGPVITDPIRTAQQVHELPELHPEAIPDIAESIRGIRAELPADKALIGFAGAPFTLASYLVEGGPSKDYARTKALMAADPVLWDELCGKLARISATFLRVQVDAGAQAIQLFDSWAGSLAPMDYATRVLPHSGRVMAHVADVPRIHFGVGTGELLRLMSQAGTEVVGVDWRVPLDEASRRIGPLHAVQGNLDPALLTAPWEVIAERARDVIRAGAKAPGHIFNLGHGVPATADPDVLTRLVALVHEEGPALRAEAATR